MDVRDVPIWRAEARRVMARRQLRAIRVAGAPYMTKEDHIQLLDELESQASRISEEEIWRRNREELLMMVGRKR